MSNIARRKLLKNGVVVAGAGLLGSIQGSPAVMETKTDNHAFNVRDFGATGIRNENATKKIQAAVEACFNSGGGTVYIPPGDYTVGTIRLKDNVNLNVEAGATLFLSQDRNDFDRGSYAMIFAEKAANISITGRGTLDGLAHYEFVEMRGMDPEIVNEIEIARKAGVDMRRYYRIGMQTFMIVLNDCTNVLISDVSVIHSPLWNIRLNDCERVFVRGVYIYSDLEKGVNADGIDICSSKNVTISDSVIITADDSIVLKTPMERNMGKVNIVENIVVTNCVLSSSSTPLMIGTETHADIRHVIFSNCTIRNSNKGFGINVQDGATVSDVLITNLTVETSRRHWNWWGSAELCKFVLRRREETSRLGKIRDIIVDTVVSHVRGTSVIKGDPESHFENIKLNNVRVYMIPEDAMDKRASDSFLFENIKGLSINDLSVDWAEDNPEPAWGSAIVLKNINDFEIRSFKGRQGLKESPTPAILLDNVSDGLIAESKAVSGCSTFISIKGKECRDIVLRGNNMSTARKGISFGDSELKNKVTIYR